MGKGSFHTASCKQKINSKGSTEDGLIVVDDCMAQIIRIRHFFVGTRVQGSSNIHNRKR